MVKIAPLPRAVRDYIAAFDLAAVARHRDGRLEVTRDPARARADWWCEAARAGQLLKAAQAGKDISTVARQLDVTVTEHSVVVARARRGRKD
jgi:hypothetical protein